MKESESQLNNTTRFVIVGFSIAVILLGCAISLSYGMVIVKDGEAVATIVVYQSDKTSKSRPGRQNTSGDKWAASVLVEWIKKISDVELSISNGVLEGRPAIYVGKAALEAGLKLQDIKSPSHEGIRIASDDQRVLLAGQNDTSTAKAACRFLEELGCRYFLDHPIGEVYPRRNTLSVGQLDIREKPGFVYRRIWGSKWNGDTLWKIWNGAGGLNLNMAHSWSKYVSKDLFAEHPEYFHLRDGKRRPSDWYCTSNPGLRTVFTEGVIAHIKAGDKHPSLSPPDGRAYCQSKECVAQDDPNSIEPSSGHVSMTNRFLDFYQYIAKRVAKVSPESILSFYCYADYTQPPTSGIKLMPNLCAWLTPIRYCRYHRISHPKCPSRRQLEEVIDGWANTAKKIGYRTYNFNLAECVVPYSKISIWKHDIPYLKKKGCIGISLETLKNWQIYGPHIYLSIRLAYDPEADADAIMDDYFMKFYGLNAGPLMKQYWMAIDEAFNELKTHSGSFYALHQVYTEDFLKRCRKVIDQARAAVKTEETYTARVEMAAEGFKNAVQYIQIRGAMNSGDIVTARRVYDDLLSRSEMNNKSGLGNHYTVRYLQRFLGKHVDAAAEASESPNKLLQILPDKWRLEYDESDKGLKKAYHQPSFNDSSWKQVATYSNTLDAQGLPDKKTVMWYRTTFDLSNKPDHLGFLFMEVDGTATVYVNGKKVGESPKSRQPFELDISGAATTGSNVVAVRVDHSQITELFLGGIIRPVYLIEKGQRLSHR